MRQIAKKNSQNWINIYVLLVKTMVVMASYECQRIQTKNLFHKI
jgi:hypothetical protein